MSRTQKRRISGKTLVSLTLAGCFGLFRASAVAQSPNINCGAAAGLDFGTIVNAPGGGVVTITPSGSRSVTGGSITVQPGGFIVPACLVNSSSPQSMQVSITAGTATMSNGTDTMAVNNFKVENDGGGPVYVYTGTTAAITVEIGASLNVGFPQGSGSYSGTFTVMATYP